MPGKTDQLSVFPVFLKVEGRTAVVIGNGGEALAKARLLKESRVDVRLVAPLPSRELGAFIIQADLTHIAAAFQPSMLEGAVLVFAATGNRSEDEAIVEAALARNIPVNAVDRPELCDFYTPALVNRAPVAVAIGSEGTGPVLTQIVRSRIEALLPRSLGQLARLAAGYRRAVEKLVPRGASRRRFWHAFFEGEVARCVEQGKVADARRHATRLLKQSNNEAGFVTIIAAGSGEPDLLTLRAVRALQQADVIFHPAKLDEAIVSLGRRDARHVAIAGTSEDATASIIAEARKGQRVVLLLPGNASDTVELGTALRSHHVDFEIVPGVAGTPVSANTNRFAA